MGAWGYGLFQGDFDYDIIDELTHEAGPGVETLYFFKTNESREETRKRLDNGVLQKLIDKYCHAKNPSFTGKGKQIRAPPNYTLIILGALAMELGCVLTPQFRQFLDVSYRHVGLHPTGQTQMAKGLSTYTNGVAHDFGSLGLHDTAEQSTREAQPGCDYVSMNVTSPEWGAWAAMEAVSKAAAAAKGDHPDDACGGCGTKDAKDGKGVLLRCSRCKTKLYCGRECQQAHWRKHKVVCKE